MIFWIAAGIVYLSVVDDWQVYAEPLEQVKIWYEGIKRDLRQAGNMKEDIWNTVSGAGEATVSGTEDVTVSGTEGIAVSEGDTAVPGTDNAVPQVDDNTAVPVEEDTVISTIDVLSPPEAELSGQEGGTAPTVISPETSAPGGGAEYHTVEDDYFADAVFIGDSRTVGLFEYGGLENTADFYASTGLTIYKMFDSEIVTVAGQKKKISVEQALTQNSYAKIYLMIGINEMGTGTVESFTQAYKDAVDHLLELQPNAILYIQGIIKVTTERSEQGDYINNEGIEARNEALSQLADNERIFYLDVNPEICDETGGMEASYTFDGVHLKAQYIDIWKTFLKEHAVMPPAVTNE